MDGSSIIVKLNTEVLIDVVGQEVIIIENVTAWATCNQTSDKSRIGHQNT